MKIIGLVERKNLATAEKNAIWLLTQATKLENSFDLSSEIEKVTLGIDVDVDVFIDYDAKAEGKNCIVDLKTGLGWLKEGIGDTVEVIVERFGLDEDFVDIMNNLFKEFNV